MNLEHALSWVTLLLYFGASVAYHAHLFAGSERARRLAAVIVPVGVVTHTCAIGAWDLTHTGSILRDPAMPFSLVAWCLALVQAGLNFRAGWSALGSLTLPLAFLTLFSAGIRAPGGAEEALASPLMRPHVMGLLLGFAAFTLAFCLAVLYLVQARLLKTKQVRGLFTRVPPLESVSTAAHRLAVIGFSMLTLGIITGAVVAPQSWGPTWYLDARTITSLVAWAIYATYLGLSMFLGFRGRRTTYFLIAGFLVVLIAFMVSVKRPRTNTTALGIGRSAFGVRSVSQHGREAASGAGGVLASRLPRRTPCCANEAVSCAVAPLFTQEAPPNAQRLTPNAPPKEPRC
jgi:ABC-type uncharacterized transport system permease subunit